MRYFTADEWARMPWHAKHRRRAALRAEVVAAEKAHVARYGHGHPLRNRGNSNTRTGALNLPKEFAA